jgi:putative nucleotidyltransferase with HDIG domain
MLPSAQGLVASTGDHIARHSETVADLAVAVAHELGLDDDTRQEVQAVALLHDVGKVGVPTSILCKRGPLTSSERRLVERHTVLGQELLERADPALDRIAAIVRACHERWDGRGYPDGLAREEIPFAARIVFCCDAYEAMTSDRPYRRAIGHIRALRELWAGAGSQFDSRVVPALVRALGRMRAAKGLAPAAARAARR